MIFFDPTVPTVQRYFFGVLQTIAKTEEKVETAQVRSPTVCHSRRFKSRSGHKTHAGTITNELWVDGPNATTGLLVSPRAIERAPHSPLRGRGESVSERERVKLKKFRNFIWSGKEC